MRMNNENLDNILNTQIPILDHGFLRVIDYMGDDSSIVQAARISYGRGTKDSEKDKSLINYLMRHDHTSPFEMCEIKFHVKMPIFVARQWVRHRTASINEYSGRYSVMKGDFYVPDKKNISFQSDHNKQGREVDDLVPDELSDHIVSLFSSFSSEAYNKYLDLLSNKFDHIGNNMHQERSTDKRCISRELARVILTLNQYTEIYWKIDLHNLLHFIRLRLDETAQYEIRVYAEEILKIVKLWVPNTYEAFVNYKLNSKNLNLKSINVVTAMIRGEKITQPNSGLSQREWTELSKIFDLKEGG